LIKNAWQTDAAKSLVKEETFENIKNHAYEQVVVFYYKSDSKSAAALKIVNKAAKKLKDELPQLRFRKCNGDLRINRDYFKEASFSKGLFVFTQTPIEGIVKYSEPLTVKDLMTHLRNQYLPYNKNDVKIFTDEDTLYDDIDMDVDQKVRFLRFTNSDCEMCKRGAKQWNIAASKWTDEAVFMDVNCDSDEDSSEFCRRHRVNVVPAMMLFTGEENVEYPDNAPKTVGGYSDFLNAELDKLLGIDDDVDDADIDDLDEDDLLFEEELYTPPVKSAPAPAPKTKTKTKAKVKSDLKKVTEKVTEGECENKEPTDSKGRSLNTRVSLLEAEIKELHTILERQKQQIEKLLEMSE